MRFTYEEIKKEIKENFEQIHNNAYPQDLLTEYADSYLPVYYNEIIADYAEMPRDYEDAWKDGVITSDTNIYTLMSYDLFYYYLAKVNQAYEELLTEREEVNA